MVLLERHRYFPDTSPLGKSLDRFTSNHLCYFPSGVHIHPNVFHIRISFFQSTSVLNIIFKPSNLCGNEVRDPYVALYNGCLLIALLPFAHGGLNRMVVILQMTISSAFSLKKMYIDKNFKVFFLMSYWHLVSTYSGNGSVSSGNKPVPEPILNKFWNAIWRHLTEWNVFTSSMTMHGDFICFLIR